MMATKTRTKKAGIKGEPRKLSVLQRNACYAIIKNVLNRYGVPSYYYSIGRFADDSVCIQYNGREWNVYEVSRGYKIHLRSFRSAYEAGSDLFRSVVIGEEKIQGMEFYLKRELVRLFSSRIISSRYTKAIVTTDSKDVVRPTKARHSRFSDSNVDAQMKRIDSAIIDGLGAGRVAAKIETTSLGGKIVKPRKVGEDIKKKYKENKESNKKN